MKGLSLVSYTTAFACSLNTHHTTKFIIIGTLRGSVTFLPFLSSVSRFLARSLATRIEILFPPILPLFPRSIRHGKSTNNHIAQTESLFTEQTRANICARVWRGQNVFPPRKMERWREEERDTEAKKSTQPPPPPHHLTSRHALTHADP